MKFWSDSFKDGGKLPAQFAFGTYSHIDHYAYSANRNPHLAWSDLPEGTQSLVLIVHDGDVPTKPDNVNQEKKTVPFDLPRTDFYHWVLVDLAPEDSPLKDGEFSNRVTPHGKSDTEGPGHSRQGTNDYAGWFKGDKEMEGNYFGYDGPFPPWNDERIHYYFFTLYALDVKKTPARGILTGPKVLKAIEKHILAQARLTALYSIYPKAK